MTAASIVGLFATLLVLSVAPGPTDLLLVTRSIKYGRVQGLVMVCGILAADFLLFAIAITGLATLLEAFGGLVIVVQYGAASYLLWVGFLQWRHRGLPIEAGDPGGSSLGVSFSTGLLSTLGEPKAIFGYMSLLPAYVDLSEITLRDALAILALVTLVVVSVKTAYVYLAARGGRLIENPSSKRVLDLASAGALVATGLFLLLHD